MKLKTIQIPFFLVIMAMPIPWLVNFSILRPMAWLPEMVALLIYMYMASSSKFSITFKRVHFLFVLIYSVHLVILVVEGRGVGGSAVLSIILMTLLFLMFFKVGHTIPTDQTYKTLIKQISIIYVIHISFILFEIAILKFNLSEFFMLLSNGIYKAGLPDSYTIVPQSLYKQSQASSQLCIFSAIWFSMLFLSRRKLSIKFNVKHAFILISSIVVFLTYPTTTLLAITLFLLFLIIYFIPFSKGNFFRLLVVVVGAIFAESLFNTFIYKINPEVYGRGLEYQNNFTDPVRIFFQLPLSEQLWGLGNITNVTNSGVKHADFGIGIQILQDGIVLSLIAFVTVVAIAFKTLLFCYRKTANSFHSFPWLWLGAVNSLILVGNLLSLVHYTVALQMGGRALFSFHIAIAMFSLYKVNYQKMLDKR